MPWVIETPPPAVADAPSPLIGGSTSAGIPHLALPFRYLSGKPVVNEQDSADDISDCVLAVCVTNPGDRAELPDFGLVDPTFGQEPLNASAAQNQIEQWEPRASLLIEMAPDQYDASIVNAQVNVELLSS